MIPVPVYDDFMNTVFAEKQHRAYKLREIADQKAQYMGKKYAAAFNKNYDGTDQRIQADFERKLKQNSEILDQKE